MAGCQVSCPKAEKFGAPALFFSETFLNYVFNDNSKRARVNVEFGSGVASDPGNGLILLQIAG
jgi:hypothetical protein